MTSFPAPPRLHVTHVPGADEHRDAIVEKLIEQGDTCVHADPLRRGVMPTFLEALDHAIEEDLTWSVIVQDDADPFRGWQQHLERACIYSPSPVLGLTYFSTFGEEALKRGAPYGMGKYLVWGGAIAYHRSILAGLTDWCRKVYEQIGYPHDDVLVPEYLLTQNLKTALTARAIFDQPVKKSLLGHPMPPAHRWERKPSATIENTDGPAWSRTPRYVNISRACPCIRPDLEGVTV